MANLLCLTLPLIVILAAATTTITLIGAKVPPNKTFKFVIYQTDLDKFEKIEYGAKYLEVRVNGDTLNFSTPPFQLCFFTTTPNAFVLGLRAGDIHDLGTMRWVWDANRNHPVRDRAALIFSADGNLAIVDADNRTVSWQTNTANKGVTGIKLLPNGNLVLHDAAGKFVWQSFDYPTDTLMIGQSLKVKGLNKLVSRKSDADASDGPYSLVLENKGLLTKVNKGGRVLTYGGWNGEDFGDLTFTVEPEPKPAKAYELIFKILSASNVSDTPLEIAPSELTYIPRVSFIRIGSDGSFKGYSYADQVTNFKWHETFSFFNRDVDTDCDLPAKCGEFGLCQQGMCVACPTPDVMLGWNESCKPPTPPPCNKKATTEVKYYKMVGVGHFLSRSGVSDEAGKIKIAECKARCDRDCKCLGYFYTEYESKCLLAPVMGTLLKDEYTVAYIKYSK